MGEGAPRRQRPTTPTAGDRCVCRHPPTSPPPPLPPDSTISSHICKHHTLPLLVHTAPTVDCSPTTAAAESNTNGCQGTLVCAHQRLGHDRAGGRRRTSKSRDDHLHMLTCPSDPPPQDFKRIYASLQREEREKIGRLMFADDVRRAIVGRELRTHLAPHTAHLFTHPMYPPPGRPRPHSPRRQDVSRHQLHRRRPAAHERGQALSGWPAPSCSSKQPAIHATQPPPNPNCGLRSAGRKAARQQRQRRRSKRQRSTPCRFQASTSMCHMLLVGFCPPVCRLFVALC